MAFSQSLAGFELEDDVLVPQVVMVPLPSDRPRMTQHLHSIPHSAVDQKSMSQAQHLPSSVYYINIDTVSNGWTVCVYRVIFAHIIHII